MELTEERKKFLVYGGFFGTFFIAILIVVLALPSIILSFGGWVIGVQIPGVAYSVFKALGVIAFFVIFIKTIIDSWTQIPQEHIWLIELFGENVAVWKSGLCLPFPYFGFMTAQEVYMGEQQMELYMQEDTPDSYGYGDVEFKDISAPVKAIVFFRVHDSQKAVYKINDLFEALEEKMDSVIRSFLGQYTIDEANILKARASLPEILEGNYLDPKSHDHLAPKEQCEKLATTSIYQEIFNNWGTEITGLAISDIILTDAQKELRRKILEAQKGAEAAAYKRKEEITLADGRKKSLSLEGDGLAYQFERLNKAGLKPGESAIYLTERKKWENVGEKGATVIESGGTTGFSGFGVRFAAGQEAFKDKTTEEGGEK